MSTEDDRYCCRSPQPDFLVPNGEGTLASNTPAMIAMPANDAISREGIALIRELLRTDSTKPGWAYLYDLSYELSQLGEEWQTSKGNYAKRLSALAYKAYQLKLTPAMLARIGDIARAHSAAASLTVEVTRDLNKGPAYFANDGSCWWSSYSPSRCALKTNGGFGLRAVDDHGKVEGRAWVMPLRRNLRGLLIPTFNTQTPDALVTFNGYGTLQTLAPARVLASMTGWTYTQIEFECAPMYVNAGGYLVAPEQTAQDVTTLALAVPQHSRLFDDERDTANVA